MKSPPAVPASKRGYSLLELSAVLAIIAVIVGVSLVAGQLQIKAAAISGTKSNLEAVRQALIVFDMKTGRYPCPATPSSPGSSDSTYGYENPGCAMSCPTGLICPLNSVAFGMVPFKTLGLNEEVAYDKWDNRITYAIDRGHVLGSQYNAGTLHIVDANSNPLTGVIAATGRAAGMLGEAIFVLISHGQNGAGAYTRNGAITVACNSSLAGTKELQNCGFSSDTFRDMPPVNSDTLANNFDDIVVWQTQQNVFTGSYFAGGNGTGNYGTNVLYAPPFSPITNTWEGTMVIDRSGHLFTFGEDNDNPMGAVGILGNGSMGTNNPVPTPIVSPGSAISDWSQLAPGYLFDCAVEASGPAYCWGRNVNGVLGNGTTTNTAVPTMVSNVSNFKMLSTSDINTCGLTKTGLIYCWGLNDHHQVGNSTASNPQLTPVKVDGGYTDWTIVQTNTYFNCGLRLGGQLWCWGNSGNIFPTGSDYPAPTQVTPTFTDWKTISVGSNSICGIRSDGTLWCWGDNYFGQLGDGTFNTQNAPEQIGTYTDWRYIRVSYSGTTCGIRGTGLAYCWGRNDYSEVGNGGFTPVPTPVAIPGNFSDWLYISMEAFTTCGYRANHSMWCWGTNVDYEFGNGTTNPSNYLVPTQITGVNF